MALTHVPVGFLPLLDSALVVLAREKGFAEREGIDLQLIRETSWANIRDRIAVGHFDAAQMLAPMPIASAVGLTPLGVAFVAPMVLGLGGNAVTVSAGLWESMAEAGAPGDLAAGPAGAALAKVIATSERRLRFGVVHQTSSHNYELRYWLAASGIRPDRDVEIVVLPPPLLPDAIATRSIDGYCVGEPWNSVGVERARAHIATVKASIWQSSPDKVLGLRADWAVQHPEIVAALVRALHGAALWCGDHANHAEAAEILARPHYLDNPVEVLSRALSGNLHTGGGTRQLVEDFFVPYARAANFPWKSHALWYYSQMVRWGQVAHSAEAAQRAAASYRPDLFRAAVAGLGVAVPTADYHPLGTLAAATPIATDRGPLEIGPDLFFDRQSFDPADLDQYVASQLSL
jgi:ABC-type nitrate/sulfonate/bicarbonate transport system substrate-binding protein